LTPVFSTIGAEHCNNLLEDTLGNLLAFGGNTHVVFLFGISDAGVDLFSTGDDIGWGENARGYKDSSGTIYCIHDIGTPPFYNGNNAIIRTAILANGMPGARDTLYGFRSLTQKALQYVNDESVYVLGELYFEGAFGRYAHKQDIYLLELNAAFDLKSFSMVSGNDDEGNPSMCLIGQSPFIAFNTRSGEINSTTIGTCGGSALARLKDHQQLLGVSVYFDENNNQQMEDAEWLPQMLVSDSSSFGKKYFYTTELGRAQMSAGNGLHKFQLEGNIPNYVSVSSSQTIDLNLNAAPDTSVVFRLSSQQIVHDLQLEYFIENNVVAGGHSSYTLIARNTGTQTSNARIQIYHNNQQQFLYATSGGLGTDTLLPDYWSFPIDLPPLSCRIMNFTLSNDVNILPGDTLSSFARIYDLNQPVDNNPNNNMVWINSIAMAAYSGNQAHILPSGYVGGNALASSDGFLYFNHRIMNNSGTQWNGILLMDSLDENVEIGTLEPLIISYSPSGYLPYFDDDGKFCFSQNNFSITDSLTQPEYSEYYFHFRAKPSATIPTGAVVQNQMNFTEGCNFISSLPTASTGQNTNSCLGDSVSSFINRCANDTFSINGLSFFQNGVFPVSSIDSSGCSYINVFQLTYQAIPSDSAQTLQLCEGSGFYIGNNYYVPQTDTSIIDTLLYGFCPPDFVFRGVSIAPTRHYSARR
jgi:hypothetical protein